MSSSIEPSPLAPMLELDSITCGYQPDVPTVRNVSLHLQPGNILCLLGPSGCGKTTTLRAIAGFERISEGEIRLQGQVLASSTIQCAS